MRAVVFDKPGGPEVLRLSQNEPKPDLKPKDVRIKTLTAAINRAEAFQRQGTYPAPPGASKLLGLECCGIITELGPEVTKWKGGERVMALLAGGGYAEEVAADEGSCIRVPDSMTDEEAGAFMETYMTVYMNIWYLGQVPDGGSILVHGGGSGIGTSAMALAKEAGVRCLVTAGSDEKCRQCRELGAYAAINYKEQNFPDEVHKVEEAGVNMILDTVGAPYVQKNCEALAMDGKIVMIGWMGGMTLKEFDLMIVVKKRISIIGSTLRARSNEFKAELMASFEKKFGAALEAGRLKPIIDRVLPIDKAAEAHKCMEASQHFGKIVLRVSESG